MRTLPNGFEEIVKAGWRFRLPENEAEEVEVEIETSVNSGWFPYKKRWNLDEFAPSRTADESFAAMTGSTSGVALGLLKGVGAAAKTNESILKTNIERKTEPPAKVTFATAVVKVPEAKIPPPLRTRTESRKESGLMPEAPPPISRTYASAGGRGGAFTQSQARLADRAGDPRGDTWWSNFSKKLRLTEKKLRYLESDLLDFSRRKPTSRNFAGADQEILNRITTEDLEGFKSRYVSFKERDTVDTTGKLLPTQMLLPVKKKE